jgi:hypothetical protein
VLTTLGLGELDAHERCERAKGVGLGSRRVSDLHTSTDTWAAYPHPLKSSSSAVLCGRAVWQGPPVISSPPCMVVHGCGPSFKPKVHSQAAIPSSGSTTWGASFSIPWVVKGVSGWHAGTLAGKKASRRVVVMPQAQATSDYELGASDHPIGAVKKNTALR